MSEATRIKMVTGFLIAYAVCAGAVGLTNQARAAASAESLDADTLRQTTSATKRHLDRSGLKRVGKASFYAKRFTGKIMADGARMNPHGTNAASKTLPLGTTAKVTNLDTGQSAIVIIQDRGPYANNRIVDLSPSIAEQIGISKDKGVAKVEVVPIKVPQRDGSVTPGVVARDMRTDKWTSGNRNR
ncbi:MAG: septal ring lytic transglycosylase RlpA family protein [Steroidobacteraceae bacterium]